MKTTWFVLALAACGGDGNTDDDTHPPDDPACTHERVVGDFLGGGEVQRCGDFTDYPAQDADQRTSFAIYNAARDCVTTAIAEQRPFVFTWAAGGIDSSSVDTYAGAVVNGTLQLAQFYSGVGKDGNFTGVYRSTCTDFLEVPMCGSGLFSGLCLQCVSQSVDPVCGTKMR